MAFLLDVGLSMDASAIRFKIIVAVLGLMLRWVDDRLGRPVTTAFAICSSELFESFDTSKRRRKSITWAFSSLIWMEQLRSFCACRFWMPITLFSWKWLKFISDFFLWSNEDLLSAIYTHCNLSHCCLEFSFHANVVALIWIHRIYKTNRRWL